MTPAPRPDWNLAACAGTAFGQQHEDQIRELCTRCPIQPACLEYAIITGQDAGVWGGMDQRQLDILRLRRANPTARTLPVNLDEVVTFNTRPTPEGHLLWTGGKSISFNGRDQVPARLVWEHRYGTPPEGQITRSCTVDGCVRHLLDLEMRRNAADISAARWLCAHCGLPITGAGYIVEDGHLVYAHDVPDTTPRYHLARRACRAAAGLPTQPPTPHGARS